MPRASARPRLAVLTSLCVAATGLGVAAPAIAAGRTSAPAPHPVTPTERHVALSALDSGGAVLPDALATPSASVAAAAATSALAARSSATLRPAALTPAVPVPSGISVVGATWPEGSMPAGTRLLVRTSTQGVWSAWQALDSDDGHDPDPGSAEAGRERGGTQPYVVTDASAVQVRLDSTTGQAPAGTSVDVVDPGTSTADAGVGTATPGAAAAAATQPTIYTRAQWGANESMRRGTVEYGSIQAAFVHHTVSQNNYSAAQVPAIIRGIYAFHVNGRGWNDIGYNFLVDRFGRIWEGRYGGIALPVVGAHTRDYNSHSFAMSAIGDFDIAHVPSAIVAAYQRLFAWKLTLHGVPAVGTVVLNGHRINRISGHRDVGQTACPGRYLYALLPSIRSGTAARMGTLPRPVLSRSLTADGTPDLLVRTTGGAAAAALSDAVSPLAASSTIGASGWSALSAVTTSPDLTGDHKPDLVARERATGRLRIYPGTGHGGFGAPVVRGSGWNSLVRLVAPGDLSGDGKADLLAVDSSGRLWLYPGDGAGWFGARQLAGASGWLAMSAVTGAGDVTGDGKADLVALRASTGQLLLYPGLGTGRFGAATVIGTGFGIFDQVLGAGDLDRDGQLDLVVRERGTGRMRTYYGRAGRFLDRMTWGRGFQNLTSIAAGSDLTGDGTPDLVGVYGDRLVLYPGSGEREYSAMAALGVDLSGTDMQSFIGDLDHNGQADVVARDTAGDLELWSNPAGAGAGQAPRRIGTGWNGMNLIAPAGDIDMDGVPDLMARDAAGTLWVYPMTSTGGFKPRRVLATGMGAMTDIVGVGPNDDDAAPDLVARTSTGQLYLYPGNGPGLLLAPRGVRSSTAGTAQFVAGGDVDGDGRGDLVARLTDGSLVLYPGTGTGGFATARALVVSQRAVGRELG